MNALPNPAVLAIADAGRGDLGAWVDAVLAGGGRWLALRDRTLPGSVQAALVRSLRPRILAMGARLTVFGALEAAALADGIHLADGDAVTVAEARKALGPAALIGVSCHDHAGLWAAQAAGADYATLSPIFASGGKPPIGLAALAAAGLSLPVLALGGVTPERAAACRAAGAAGLAAIRATATRGAVAALLSAWTCARA